MKLPAIQAVVLSAVSLLASANGGRPRDRNTRFACIRVVPLRLCASIQNGSKARLVQFDFRTCSSENRR
jgi:hypothetical protein